MSTYDATKQPLTIETLESGTTITFSPTSAAQRFECTYSTDGGQSWNAVSYNDGNKAVIVVPAAGTKVLLRSDAGSCKSTAILFDKDCYVYGNAMSAICGENFGTVTKLSYSNYGAFNNLFKGNTHLRNHPTADILLPATNAPSYCYACMFSGCTSLQAVPSSIKAASLEDSACMSMFENCSSIVSAPEIDATQYGSSSLANMFKSCVKLERGPVLKAASLLNGCCNGIFWDCSSLSYIKCLATEFKFNSSEQGTMFFSYGVAASGTFVRSVALRSISETFFTSIFR